MLTGLRWILFDAVGTLIRADPPVAEVYRSAAAPFGSRLTADDISSRFRPALAAEHSACLPTSELAERDRWRRIVARVIDDAPHAAEPIFDRLWRHFAQPTSWRLYPDAPPVLEELRRRGHQVAIASNFDARLFQIVRGHPPLAACDACFVSSTVGYTKPDLRFFRAIERQLSARPAEIALVGDDPLADVNGAAAAGWRSILLDRDGQLAKDSASASAIRSLAALL